MIPDSWVAAILPPFLRRKLIAGTEKVAPVKTTGEPDSELEDPDKGFEAPLRTLTFIRGERARTGMHRTKREYFHDQKVKVKAKAQKVMGSKSNSRTDLETRLEKP